jgi:hypothetical protein
MGSLYRSQNELLPLLKKGTAPHVNNIELGKRGRWRSSLDSGIEEELQRRCHIAARKP